MLQFDLPFDFDPAVVREIYAFGGGLAGLDEEVTMLVCSPASTRRKFYDVDYLATLPNLRLLATASTGTNHIDLDACAARGIKVLSLLDDRDGLNTISASAEWTFKLVLEGLRLKRPCHELQGRTVGLVGYGRIGHRLARWCDAMGTELWYCDPGVSEEDFATKTDRLQHIFGHSEIVVICCALTPETTGMVNYDLLRRLPPEAVLVNTARGEVVNEADLCRFMAERPDVRVCLDVVTGEVDGTANPERLRQLGAYVSDHIAGETYESRTKAAKIVLGLLKKELAIA